MLSKNQKLRQDLQQARQQFSSQFCTIFSYDISYQILFLIINISLQKNLYKYSYYSVRVCYQGQIQKEFVQLLFIKFFLQSNNNIISKNNIKLLLMLFDKKNCYLRASINLICAGASMTLANPIELIRIRMQTCNQLVQIGSLNKSYSGIFDCLKRVQYQEGLRAFWKGNAAKLIRFYCSETINFCSKEIIHKFIKSNDMKSGLDSFAKNIASGVVGSWISLSLLYPIEHARNCLSNSIGNSKTTILGSIRNTVRFGGIRALYVGSSVSMAGVAIFRGTNFGIFDTFKGNKQGLERWLLAYFSSTLAILLTYPSDTVRRRMICAQKKQRKYTGFFDCLTKMYKSQGIKSFYRGGPVIFIQSLSSSIVLYCYDKLAAEAKINN